MSVTELEAQMLARGAFSQQHQQAPGPQPAQRPAQLVYNHGNSGLYSPSAAAALARLTQSAQQGHQPQSGVASSPSVQRPGLATQMQQRQGRSNGPGPPGQYAASSPQKYV